MLFNNKLYVQSEVRAIYLAQLNKCHKGVELSRSHLIALLLDDVIGNLDDVIIVQILNCQQKIKTNKIFPLVIFSKLIMFVAHLILKLKFFLMYISPLL